MAFLAPMLAGLGGAAAAGTAAPAAAGAAGAGAAGGLGKSLLGFTGGLLESNPLIGAPLMGAMRAGRRGGQAESGWDAFLGPKDNPAAAATSPTAAPQQPMFGPTDVPAPVDTGMQHGPQMPPSLFTTPGADEIFKQNSLFGPPPIY
jgi:hypothetical protein